MPVVSVVRCAVAWLVDEELPGQRHDVDAKVLAPVLADFFCASPVGAGG
jgi:hypothetical protein